MNTPMRASLRAALAVSGLTAAFSISVTGCAGSPNAEPTTPNPSTLNPSTLNPSTPNRASSNPTLTDGHCQGSWSEYSEACCARESDATWSVERGCEPTVMVGPFVPPEMNA